MLTYHGKSQRAKPLKIFAFFAVLAVQKILVHLYLRKCRQKASISLVSA